MPIQTAIKITPITSMLVVDFVESFMQTNLLTTDCVSFELILSLNPLSATFLKQGCRYHKLRKPTQSFIIDILNWLKL